MKYITTLLVFFLFMASCHKEEDTDTQTDENGLLHHYPINGKNHCI